MTSTTSESSILIYAELLSNIRQVSVAATLPSQSDSSTSAKLSEDGQLIHVHHKGKDQSLLLPAGAAFSAKLPIPLGPSSELTWRLPVNPAEAKLPQAFPDSDALPWTSADLEVGSRISCRACSSTLVAEATIKTWKDLPSENWAEMMEFWHCHKPHDHDRQQQPQGEDDVALAAKGYSASNIITARPQEGLVDVASFMFSERDCQNVTFSTSTPESEFTSSTQALDSSPTSKFLHNFCKVCHASVGLYNVLASAVTLFKWQVECQTAQPSRPPTAPECLAATLAATISRSGSSKSIITPPSVSSRQAKETDEGLPLHLWVLNPLVTYSSSSTAGKRVAMKILHKDIGTEEADKLIESMSLNIQEISLPTTAIMTARETLRSTSSLLPLHERTFQGWKVGLLDRWS